MNSIRTVDDYFHPPNKRSDWRESYYFNFVDLEDGIAGFTTIGILPNQNKQELIMVLFYDEKRKVYSAERQLTLQDESLSLLSDKHLSYELLKPLEKWKIKLAHDNLNLELLWQARFPAYDFGKGSGTSWEGHFEQSGQVKGKLSFAEGRKIKIRGYGQRDKSWGPRDWHIDGWYALQAQFNSFAIGIRRDIVKGTSHVSGGLFSASAQTAIEKIDLEVTYMKNEPQTLREATTAIYFVNRKSYTLRSSLISPTSFFKFSRPFPEGLTELFEGMVIHECMETGEKGTGLVEFLTTHTKTRQ